MKNEDFVAIQIGSRVDVVVKVEGGCPGVDGCEADETREHHAVGGF